MSRGAGIVRNIVIGAALLVTVLAAAAWIVIRTEWFRDFARKEIVSATEDATGGRVDIGSFEFDASQMRATIKDFVIHGREPAGSVPFLRAHKIVAEIRLLSGLRRLIDISYLGVDRLEANIVILADGRSNIPSPKNNQPSRQSPLKTVVDLAVGRFDLNNGLVALELQKVPLNIRGNDLRVQLVYNALSTSYRGELSYSPLYVASGRNTPVNFRVTLPVTVRSNGIEVHRASISTAASKLSIDGSVENLQAPRFTARIGGTVSLADLKNLADLPVAVNERGVPSQVQLAADVTALNDSVRIARLQAAFGGSSIDAEGSEAALMFHSTLDLSELGRLFRVDFRPQGAIVLNGTASVGPNSAYSVTGDLLARDLSFQQGATRIRDIGISSSIRANQNSVELDGLRVTAFGGQFIGSASLKDFQAYELKGDLRSLDLGSALSTVGEKLPYDGVISGPIAAKGDAEVASSLTGDARLVVTPGKRGIPVSGRLNADYSEAANNLTISNSYIALPHTRLDLNGALNKVLNISLTTHDLSDLLAATSVQGQPVALNHGEATFTGALLGGLRAPRITGHLAANRLVVEERPFDSLAADLAASGSGAAITNGIVTRAAMQAHLSGSVGLSAWKLLPSEPVAADLSISDSDLADLIVLARQKSSGYSGALTATAHIAGTAGNPLGAVTMQAANGMIDGQPFDHAHVQANLTNQLVTIPDAYIDATAGRVDLNGEFRHPADSFTIGHLHATLASNQLDLAKTTAQAPNLAGTIQMNLELGGDLTAAATTGTQTEDFLITSANGNVSARALKVEGQSYGDLQATARTSGQMASYSLASDFAGSTIHLNGSTQLIRGYPTTADATLANLPIDKVLAAVKRTDIPARGSLSGTIHLTGAPGMPGSPQVEANFDLTRAVLYDEPIDSLRVRGAYLARSIDISHFQIVAGQSQIDLTAHYDHAPGNLQAGNASFQVNSSRIDLAHVHNIQMRRPGLGGTFQITGHGEGTVREGAPRIVFRDLNVNVDATGISDQNEKFGDLKLAASEAADNKIDFSLDSNLAGASIHGRGSAELTAGYPVTTQLSFNNILYTHIAKLMRGSAPEQQGVEAAVDGQASVNGPALNVDQLRATLQLTRVNITANPNPGQGKPVLIANLGPVTVALDHGSVRVQNAHIFGSQADIQVAGSASLPTKTLDLTVNAKIGLGVLPNFDRDIYSSGDVSLAATVGGTISQPVTNGQLVLRDATFNYSGIPNGISNANGTAVFSGTTASIRNLTAESGGGQLAITGFAQYGNISRFGLRVKATRVRTRVQEGVSIVSSADLQVAGTSRNSVISGTAVVDQVNYNPQTDIALLLARAAPAVEPDSTSTRLLQNMRLDVRVRTSSGLAVRAEIARGLSATADLRLQGTVLRPGVRGMVTINEGTLVFFGSSYKVDNGTISFYNPLQIEPILDISLETETQGVSVIVRVTGPIYNLKLSYTSNPPLQFQEIVGLLAAGRAPTSDPTLLANQPQVPQSSFGQMGESAALGEAVTNPVAGRLQRVFGISQLKVDPAFQGGSEIPTARLELQQRISNNLTFTYTSALDDPNGEIVKIEWAFDPKWSAVATRDQNGIFSINFLYKRQFR